MIIYVVMLDLPAAFDTIDFPTLLTRVTRLYKKLGFRGKALSWISSYLSDRWHEVRILDVWSPPQTLDWSILLGTIVEP